MKAVLEELTEMVAIVCLTLVAYFMLSHGVDYFLLLTDIIAIAGIAGYKIKSLPAKKNAEKGTQ